MYAIKPATIYMFCKIQSQRFNLGLIVLCGHFEPGCSTYSPSLLNPHASPSAGRLSSGLPASEPGVRHGGGDSGETR